MDGGIVHISKYNSKSRENKDRETHHKAGEVKPALLDRAGYE